MMTTMSKINIKIYFISSSSIAIIIVCVMGFCLFMQVFVVDGYCEVMYYFCYPIEVDIIIVKSHHLTIIMKGLTHCYYCYYFYCYYYFRYYY